MLDALITSRTRIKLMLKFFLNTSSTGYLRGLEAEFSDSTNAIRLELNRFEEAGLLEAHNDGHRKIFQANKKHPLFSDIQSIIRKYIGIDDIIERVINQLGEPEEVYLIGDLARGLDSNDINLIIVGSNTDLDYLESLVGKAQPMISRKIGYLVLTPDEFKTQRPYLNEEKLLKVWEKTD
ncbi:MAG: ArsR family transcriptional regulator [Bacteroidales bacterium]|nr:ArsR family transcriptional regulator [Bacteroidales bacterium]